MSRQLKPQGESWRHFLFLGVIMLDYKNSDMCRAIDEYVRNPRYRNVLRYRFCESMTYEQIAEKVNYSTQHVKYICKTYKEMLLRHL